MTEQIDAGMVAEQIADSDQLSSPDGARELGKRRTRKEDAKLVTGQTMWTDSMTFPGLLQFAILRSPMAHATITRIDVSPALEMPGVFAAFSGADLAEQLGSLPCAWPVTAEMVTPAHPPHRGRRGPLRRRRGRGRRGPRPVRRRGCARGDRRRVRAAARRSSNMESALEEGSPLAHSDKGTNRCFDWPFAGGDYAAAKAAADVVVSRRYIQQRLLPSAMEPRAVVVAPIAAADEYTVYSSTQIPHILRIMLALTTGIPEQKIRVITPDVGGGFGSKLNVYAEEVDRPRSRQEARAAGAWTESRSEGYQATIHGRDQIQDVEIAARADGTILGLKVDLFADMGAYLQLVTPGVPILGAFMYNAIYKMDAYSSTAPGVFTTKTPTDAYRGAGRPEATFAIERIMDELAAELGCDPLELRRAELDHRTRSSRTRPSPV